MAEYKTDAQVNYGWGLSLNMTGKAPAVAKIIWGTYADLLAYVNDPNDSAIAGSQLAVVNDSDKNKNGIYFVESIGDGTTDGVVNKVGEVSQAALNALIARVASLETNVTNLQTSKADNFTVGNGLSYTNNKINVTIDPISGNALQNTESGLKVIIPDVVVPEYTVAKLGKPSEGASASYQLQKDGTGIGAIIDIPKDMVIESGNVKEVTENDKPYIGAKIGDLYIDIVLANSAGTHIYIPANKLVDNYTGSTYIAVDENRVITLNYTLLKNQLQADLSTAFDIPTLTANVAQNAQDIITTNGKVTTLENTVGDATKGLVKAVADNTTAIGELSTDVESLKTKVTTLENTVGDATKGLVKAVADNTTAIGVNTSSITSLSNVVSGKLDNDAKVNGKSFVQLEGDDFPSITLNAPDIKIVDAVGPNIAGSSIENVLVNLNTRIESAVSGGLTSVAGGAGIFATPVTGNSQTLSIKLKTGISSEVASVSADGLDIKDMRAYWVLI